MNHVNLPYHNPSATVSTLKQYYALGPTTMEVVFDNGFSEPGLVGLDLSRFPNLQSLEVGSDAFFLVPELSLVGLNELESVVIGERSFKAVSGDHPTSSVPGRRFQLKDCPKLTTLELGMGSFKSYSVCAIENNAALETLAFGKVSEEMSMFFSGSLELKSAFIHRE